jgi:hypothetical protein
MYKKYQKGRGGCNTGDRITAGAPLTVTVQILRLAGRRVIKKCPVRLHDTQRIQEALGDTRMEVVVEQATELESLCFGLCLLCMGPGSAPVCFD